MRMKIQSECRSTERTLRYDKSCFHSSHSSLSFYDEHHALICSEYKLLVMWRNQSYLAGYSPFGFLAPYFERPIRRSSTPVASYFPRTTV